MSESTKLIFGTALVAVGFGVATLLGPPQNNAQWQSFRGESPLRPVAGQQATVAGQQATAQPHSLQLRAGANKLSDTGSSQVTLSPTTRSPSTQSTPQWLAPVSVEQSGVQPAGLFSDHTTGRAQFASMFTSAFTSANPSVANQEKNAESEPPFNRRENGRGSGRESNSFSSNLFSTTRPVYEVVQSFASSRSAQRARDPLQDYDDSHWLDDVVSEAGEQQHVVADGDTLAKLADIYLGDSQREWEIYHNNREVLNSPELLPIGAVLTIPARVPTDLAMGNLPAEKAPAEKIPAEKILEPIPASNRPPAVDPGTFPNSVPSFAAVSSFAVSHQPAFSEMPSEMPSEIPLSNYSGLSTSFYSAGPISGEPGLVPVKPVTVSTSASASAPHAHLLMPIPIE